MSTALIRVMSLLAASAFACAAHASELPEAAASCAAVASPAERLACYDRVFPPAIGAETLAEQARADFGLTREESTARNPGLAPPSGPDSIRATVANVAERSRGSRVITLDNGQVWAQTDASSLGSVEAGDSVELKRGSFSSYRLMTEGGVPLKVRRVR